MRHNKLFLLISLIVILAMAAPVSAQVNPPASGVSVNKLSGDVYIVQMKDSPVIAYEGEILGFKATKPAAGKKIDPLSSDVVKYAGYLKDKHDKSLLAVGASGKKLYDYVFSLNGYAARLTASQLAAVKLQPGVAYVWKDELRKPVTDNSPDFLGLTAEDGLWDLGIKGENVIIGVIDTGIWPEHPSFSDRTAANPNGKPGKLDYQQIPGWHGKCVPGQFFTAANCNQKLIGAQYFYEAWGKSGITNDYLSARDHDGHGTHTASTAGGNAGVKASILNNPMGTVSGIAPRARIAVYKALWNDQGGYSSDLSAAIDQAVADGVDVINYSIGSSGIGIGPDDISFLFAQRAGIFVAVSAGNEGPGASTVGSPAGSPWLTTVAASTQDRTYLGSVLTGADMQYFGTSITAGTAELQIVNAADYGDEMCGPGELDEAVAGKIVLCKRGVYARVDKSYAVWMAHGAGMVLYNATDTQTLDTDNHFVPSVHINYTDGAAIKAYIASEGEAANAQLFPGSYTGTTAPSMADFSSRGPNGQSFDVIKPDITAPGVNILAGNTPTPYIGAPGQLFQMIGGTSMSSPHIAGIFALLKEAHPDWTAAMAKSAIMTTAYQAVTKEDGSTPADPFDFGAGHVDPNKAVDPGLVYNAGWNDYLAYLCAVDPSWVSPATCSSLKGAGYSLDPSQMNIPSIAIGELAGIETVKRTVTSVFKGSATYNAEIEAPAGVEVEVVPSSFTLTYGMKQSFDVAFTVTDAAVLNEFSFGSLTWSDGTHIVRIPIAVKPMALAYPGEVYGSGVEGMLDFNVTFGYSGVYSAEPLGLAPATMEPENVLDDPANDINAALETCDWSSFPYQCTGITWHRVLIPAGANYARFQLFDDFTDGEDDLDLYVWGEDGFYGSSGSGTSAERVDSYMPGPGYYEIAVHGWGADGPDANYTLFSWVVGPDMGNMTLSAPSAATLGATEPVTINWAGLDPDQKYLGAVAHNGPAGLIGLTLLNVDTMP